MNEYKLHTLGAAHNFTPPYDGRDPMRNRPYEHCAQIAEAHPFSPVIGQAIAAKIRTAAPKAVAISAKRYGILPKYEHGVGIPSMMESETGQYVTYRDYMACVAHNEMLLTMRKIAEDQCATKDAEIARLREAICKIKDWDITQAVSSGFVTLTIPLDIRREMEAALTQQEQA